MKTIKYLFIIIALIHSQTIVTMAALDAKQGQVASVQPGTIKPSGILGEGISPWGELKKRKAGTPSGGVGQVVKPEKTETADEKKLRELAERRRAEEEAYEKQLKEQKAKEKKEEEKEQLRIKTMNEEKEKQERQEKERQEKLKKQKEEEEEKKQREEALRQEEIKKNKAEIEKKLKEAQAGGSAEGARQNVLADIRKKGAETSKKEQQEQQKKLEEFEKQREEAMKGMVAAEAEGDGVGKILRGAVEQGNPPPPSGPVKKAQREATAYQTFSLEYPVELAKLHFNDAKGEKNLDNMLGIKRYVKEQISRRALFDEPVAEYEELLKEIEEEIKKLEGKK